MSVQKNILAQMTRVGMSNRSLAKEIGVDPQAVSSMLRGETEIDFHQLRKIAKALRLTTDDLEQDADYEERSLISIVSDNITTYRQKRGISRERFAKICGLSQAQICRIERQYAQGGRPLNFNLNTLVTIAKCMGITVPQLLTPNCEPIETPPVVIEPTDPVEPPTQDLYTTIYTAVKAALKEVF